MSTALDVILESDGVKEVTVEIDSAKRSDGTPKTWYTSTHMRSTGAAETPANTEFLPFLTLGGVLGPLSQSLTEDALFSGVAQVSAGTLTLTQSVVDNDQLSTFNDYVFAGYSVRIKIGLVSSLYSTFELYRTLIINIDPVVELTSAGLRATFSLSNVLTRMLNETLSLGRYVGIPTCAEVLTTSAVASTTYSSAHDVTSFTIIYRILASSLPAANRNLIAKTLATTNSNFALNFNTTGVIQCMVSLAGVSTTLHTSSTSLANSRFHTIVWSLLDKATSYLMIDGVVIGTFTALTSSVDLPATGVRMARFLAGKHCDARLYNRYMAPEEARGVSSVRSDGQDIGCVGCWRFDDGGSSTVVNDYSPTNADATWTGVLNTDYRWVASYLGEPELAGRSYPLNVGNVFNFQSHYIDIPREIYRANVDAASFWSTSNITTRIKSQGTVLTPTTDYTLSATDGIFTTVSHEAEPVTVDILTNGVAEYGFYPSSIAYDVLSRRTRILGSQIGNVDPLTLLCPWPSGYHTEDETDVAKVLSDILGQSGLHYRETEQGKLWFDFLLPPVGYGPYGEPCLDLRGGYGNRVEWGDIADITGSCTVACWVKLQIVDQTAYNWGASEPNQGSMQFLTKGGLAGNYTLWFQAIGADAGKVKFKTGFVGGSTASTPAGVITPYIWHFVAGVFDDTANTAKIYIAPIGGTLVELANVTNNGSQSTNSNNLSIGASGSYSWMSVSHSQIWNVAKSQAQLQALMTTPPVGNESNLVFYSKMNSTTLDSVSGTSGTIVGQNPADPSGYDPAWCPKLSIDLNITPSVKLRDFHHTHPAWKILVNYAKNYFKMTSADIDTGVSANDRLALKADGLNTLFESTEIRDRYKNAKKIELYSPIADSESANKLLRALAYRFSTNNYVGSLSFPAGLRISAQSLGVQIGDEIAVRSDYPSQLSVSLCFRVVSVAPNPLQLSNTVAIWK